MFFLSSLKIALLRWIICEAYLRKATLHYRKRVYSLGARLLGKVNTWMLNGLLTFDFRVSAGDEMNLVLLKLVEYLGHTNPLICGLAYDEVGISIVECFQADQVQIQRLSNHSPFSAMKLFAPYWGTIAVTVVQDLHRRPQITQQVSDLLAMSVSDFLSMTQIHTVPFFVLIKKQDILQRIADACSQSIMALCREHNNLAAILSCVLLRTSSDVESLVMNLLNAVSPEFSNVDCAELLKSEPQATASELLRAGGEADEAKKAKVCCILYIAQSVLPADLVKAHQALHFLAGVTHGKLASGRGTARKSDVTGPFFETHVLGIMALLADTINDGKGPQPMLEKIRCLGAIRDMVKLAKSHVSNGLPQVLPASCDLQLRLILTHRYVHAYALPSRTKIYAMKGLMHGSL